MLGCLDVHLVAESVLVLWECVYKGEERFGSGVRWFEFCFITDSRLTSRKRKLENGGLKGRNPKQRKK